jgi:hypothetical protein
MVMKSLPIKKSPRPDGSTAKFCKTFKEELTPVFLKLFHKVEREGILSHLLYEASITLIPKQDKNSKEKENYRPISLMNIGEKNPQ